MDEPGAGIFGKACRCLHRFLEIGPGELDSGPVAAGGFDLGNGGRLRHEHGCRHLAQSGGQRYALRVVAGGGGHDAATALRFVEARDHVHRTAYLERAGPLQTLRLEQDPASGEAGERHRGDERGGQHRTLLAAPGFLDVGQR